MYYLGLPFLLVKGRCFAVSRTVDAVGTDGYHQMRRDRSLCTQADRSDQDIVHMGLTP